MKGSIVFATVFALLSPSFCINIQSLNSSVRKGFKHVNTGFIRTSYDAARIGDNSACSACVQITGQLINQLLNIILNVGVVGTCETLCSYLPTQLEEVICNLACDYFGVEEFVKEIEKLDLDPIYMCEIIKTCPIFDGGDCKITQLDVTPKSGPQGEFVIGLTYVSKNGTGTGEMDVDIRTVDGIPVGDAFLHEAEAGGTYPVTIKLKAEPDPDCDPTQGFCEMWLPGNYTVKIAMCNGECGSKHPHSQIYDKAETNFTITG